ncbi:MAG: terpene cyclase/mutase family protein [Planctomycetes bacterium]|nr:terpene cyclase/mutase family protein [Planctomycetota bacterium]
MTALALGLLAPVALTQGTTPAFATERSSILLDPVRSQDQEPSERAAVARVPVPAELERRVPRERIEELLDLPMVRSSQDRARQKATLVRLLQAGCSDGGDPPAERYSFLELALGLAEQMREPSLVREVITAMEARFAIPRASLLLSSARTIAAEQSDAAPVPATLVSLFIEAGALQLEADLAAAEQALHEAREVLSRCRGSEATRATRDVEMLASRVRERILARDRLPAAELRRAAPPPEADPARQTVRDAFRQSLRELQGQERGAWKAALDRWSDEGLATRRNSAGTRYESLRTALSIAGKLGDLRALEELLAELELQFEVDRLAIERDVLREAADSGGLGLETSTRALLALAARALPTRSPVAQQALADAEAMRTRMKQDHALSAELGEEVLAVKSLVAMLAEEEELRAALIRQPDDAASAERLGWLLCLRRERWSEGLPLLAAHASSKLKDGSSAREIARLDFVAEPSAADLRRIAAAWREHAETVGLSAVERRALLRRASERYGRIAMPTALDRLELAHLSQELAALSSADFEAATDSVPFPHLGWRFARGDRARLAGGAGTESAVQSGLRWLKEHQSEDGRWDADAFHRHCEAVPCDGDGASSHDVGLTGLALLAFLGDGHHPNRKTPYQRVVRSGVTWLVENMSEGHDDGLIGGRSNHAFMYDHAVAALALCEAYLLSQQENLRGPAQRAVNFVLRARNPYKAWRYEAPPNGENDSSITGWMVRILKTAEDAGLDVDKAAYEGARSLFDELTDSSTGRCGYINRGEPPARPTGKADKWPAANSESLTAVALLSRFFLGETPQKNPLLSAHAELMLSKLPAWKGDDVRTVDLYYWVHGASAMFLMGGKYWEKWNNAMKPTLVVAQRKDGHLAGSWDPVDPWGEDGGRIYSTAMCVLCLQVYYRYERK